MKTGKRNSKDKDKDKQTRLGVLVGRVEHLRRGRKQIAPNQIETVERFELLRTTQIKTTVLVVRDEK